MKETQETTNFPTDQQANNALAKPTMPRRTFAKVMAGGLAGLGLVGPTAVSLTQAQPAARRNLKMHVGGDYHVTLGDHWTSKMNFEYHQRMGIKHMTNIMSPDDWRPEDLKLWKSRCDDAGMIWEAIRMDSSFIYLPPGAERDRKMEEVIGHIKMAAAVGVKVITMHWTMIPIRRNGHKPGRGGSSYESFELEENWKDLPVGRRGRVSYDEYWERITYFLNRAIPVCEQVDVRLAVHPYDPPGLPKGYQGVDNWDAAPTSVFDSLKRYEAVIDSPYNGFQLCLGTVMEGLQHPKTGLLPIVRYFAEKGKIHQIHMRNIRGGLHNFQEVYIDEGEANFIEVIRILRDTDYTWSICPDHVPTHPDDPRRAMGFAHGFGYIQALIDAANSEIA